MTRLKKSLLLVIVPILIGVGSYLFSNQKLHKTINNSIRGKAIANFSRKVELDEFEAGKVIDRDLLISNTGNAPLIIDNVTSSCVCSGLLQEVNGTYHRIERIIIEPKQEKIFKIHMTPRGIIGKEFVANFTFRMNEDDNDIGEVHVVVKKVTGGVSLQPPVAAFGKLRLGEKSPTVVKILDFAAESRVIRTIACTRPDLFEVRLEQKKTEKIRRTENDDGVDIGHIVIIPKTTIASDLEGFVVVYLNDSCLSPDRIALTGTVVPDVSIKHARLILPKSSSDGLLYEQETECSSFTGTPFQITLKEAPSDLNVGITKNTDSSYSIKVRLNKDARRTGRLLKIVYQVQGDSSYELIQEVIRNDN